MEHITDYKNKKLVEYLYDGAKCCLRFGHGLGDTMMFYPVFKKLASLYPNVTFDLYLESGQEKIFPCVQNYDESKYDYVFDIHFLMSEATQYAKAELCCLNEIGIEPIIDLYKFEKTKSPFVAVHFQSTSLPGVVNCDAQVAEKIWNEILSVGLIPIECHFEHMFHNPVNKQLEFVNRHVRDVIPEIKTLVALMQHSFAFVGIASGPFVVAASTFIDRTIYLKKDFDANNYTTEKIIEVDIKNYQDGIVKSYLEGMIRDG